MGILIVIFLQGEELLFCWLGRIHFIVPGKCKVSFGRRILCVRGHRACKKNRKWNKQADNFFHDSISLYRKNAKTPTIDSIGFASCPDSVYRLRTYKRLDSICKTYGNGTTFKNVRLQRPFLIYIHPSAAKIAGRKYSYIKKALSLGNSKLPFLEDWFSMKSLTRIAFNLCYQLKLSLFYHTPCEKSRHL